MEHRSTEPETQKIEEKQKRYLAELASILPRFYRLLIILIVAGVISLSHPEAQAEATQEPEGVGTEQVASPESLSLVELFVHSYDLGQARNPHLSWPLRAGGTADIFPELLRFEEGSGFIFFRPEVLQRFDIAEEQAFQLLAGYSYGVWGMPGENPAEIAARLSILVFTDYDAFVEACGIYAGACFSPGNSLIQGTINLYNDDYSKGSIPHETGHANFTSQFLWPHNEFTQINDVRLTTEPHDFLSMHSESGQDGVLEYVKLNEAVAELHSNVVTRSIGLPLPLRFYGTPLTNLYSADVYAQLLDILVADPSKTAAIHQLFPREIFAAVEVFELSDFLGEIILSIDPTYVDRILSDISANPEAAAQRSFLTFSLTQGETVALLQSLPPETSAGYLLLSELSGAARNYSANNNTIEESDSREVAVLNPLEYANIDPFTGKIRIEEVGREWVLQDRENPFMINYRWGSATEAIGPEQVELIMNEFRATGDVVTNTIGNSLTPLVVIEQLGPEFSTYFADPDQDAFERAVISTALVSPEEYGRMVPQNWALPYFPRKVESPQTVAGQQMTIIQTEIVFDQSRFSTRNAVWGLVRGVMGSQFDASYDYYGATRWSVTDTHNIMSVPFPAGGHDLFSILEPSTVNGPEGSVQVTDVVHLPDLFALLITESLTQSGGVIPADHPLFPALTALRLNINPDARGYLLMYAPSTPYGLTELSLLMTGEQYTFGQFDETHVNHIKNALALITTMPPIQGMRFTQTTLENQQLAVYNTQKNTMGPYQFLEMFNIAQNLNNFTVYPVSGTPQG